MVLIRWKKRTPHPRPPFDLPYHEYRSHSRDRLFLYCIIQAIQKNAQHFCSSFYFCSIVPPYESYGHISTTTGTVRIHYASTRYCSSLIFVEWTLNRAHGCIYRDKASGVSKYVFLLYRVPWTIISAAPGGRSHSYYLEWSASPSSRPNQNIKNRRCWLCVRTIIRASTICPACLFTVLTAWETHVTPGTGYTLVINSNNSVNNYVYDDIVLGPQRKAKQRQVGGISTEQRTIP